VWLGLTVRVKRYTAMEYRVPGKTGLRVSRIAFGVYSITGLYGLVGGEKAAELS
jgi:aryl-alcohol dehydrogenase-like predicted oxidoreductase